MNPKHQKITKFTPQKDGSIVIEEESYYEDLTHYRREIEKQVLTSREGVLGDIVDALKPIYKQGSPKVIITVIAKNGQPVKIVKRWVETVEKLA